MSGIDAVLPPLPPPDRISVYGDARYSEEAMRAYALLAISQQPSVHPDGKSLVPSSTGASNTAGADALPCSEAKELARMWLTTHYADEHTADEIESKCWAILGHPDEATKAGFRAFAISTEARVRALLWGEHPECCGNFLPGNDHGILGQEPDHCCGCPEPSMLNNAQIVASLRAMFREVESAASAIATRSVEAPDVGKNVKAKSTQGWGGPGPGRDGGPGGATP